MTFVSFKMPYSQILQQEVWENPIAKLKIYNNCTVRKIYDDDTYGAARHLLSFERTNFVFENILSIYTSRSFLKIDYNFNQIKQLDARKRQKKKQHYKKNKKISIAKAGRCSKLGGFSKKKEFPKGKVWWYTSSSTSGLVWYIYIQSTVKLHFKSDTIWAQPLATLMKLPHNVYPDWN